MFVLSDLNRINFFSFGEAINDNVSNFSVLIVVDLFLLFLIHYLKLQFPLIMGSSTLLLPNKPRRLHFTSISCDMISGNSLK